MDELLSPLEQRHLIAFTRRMCELGDEGSLVGCAYSLAGWSGGAVADGLQSEGGVLRGQRRVHDDARGVAMEGDRLGGVGQRDRQAVQRETVEAALLTCLGGLEAIAESAAGARLLAGLPVLEAPASVELPPTSVFARQLVDVVRRALREEGQDDAPDGARQQALQHWLREPHPRPLSQRQWRQ